MAREKSVCFTGHRIVGSDFSLGRLGTIVVDTIESGFDTFIVGGALGFDTIVAKLILMAKKDFPHIKLHVYIPCNNQDAKWSMADKQEYRKILDRADYVDMVDRPYFDGCMQERNYKMVDNASVCICYYTGKRSGTSQTVNYAKRQGLKIINTSNKEVII
jgi:uncharacterized phage-like protein YoqJ